MNAGHHRHADPMNALIDAAKDTADTATSVWIALVGPALVALIGAAALIYTHWGQGKREDKIRADATQAAKDEAARVEREREADRQHHVAMAWRAERVAAYREFRNVATEIQRLHRLNHAALDNENIDDIKAFDRALRIRLRDARSEVVLVGGDQVVEACDKAATALLREDFLRVRPRARTLEREGALEPLPENPMQNVDAVLKHFTQAARRELGITELQIEE